MVIMVVMVTWLINPASFLISSSGKSGMDVAILLDNILQVLARHAIYGISNVHFGCDQEGGCKEEDDCPDIVHAEKDVVNVNTPAIKN